MRKFLMSLTMMAALAVGFTSTGYAASADLADDSVPAGTTDVYELRCQGTDTLTATVTGAVPTDTFSAILVCTEGPDKGAFNSGDGNPAVVSVGSKCKRTTIAITCSSAPCPGPDCGSYTINGDCGAKNVSEFSQVGDDLL
ncbi:MAG: hypothetical protein ACREQ3_20460 [Candidatus Binatia bacterium]